MNIKKLVIGLAVVVMVFGVAVSAKAATIEELQAMIASLTAQIAALSGGSTAGSLTTAPVPPLTVGSSGAQVTALQNWLISNGYQIPAGATGYFGAQTQAAVKAYQVNKAISPAVGYYGSITAASVQASLAGVGAGTGSTGSTGTTGCAAGALFSATTGLSCTTSTALSGGAGEINDVDYVTSINNEKVGEDESDVSVVGLDVEADDGSDLVVSSVKLNFSKGTGATHDFDKYATEVSVWLDGKEYGRADASEFTKSNNYDKSISLSSGAIIKAGETSELLIKVSGIGNLDTADAGDTWTAEIESIRTEDASGAIVTDSTTGDINDGAGRSFTFETFATATDVELKIAEDSATINDAHVIDVHASDDTLDVPVASFTFEAKGDSDLTINRWGASTTVTGATDVDDLIKEITLWIDGKEIASGEDFNSSVTPTTQKTWMFDELDYTIPAGDKVDAEIKVTFNSVADSLDEGDTIAVDMGENQTDDAVLIDVTDESGEQLVDADLTGTVAAGADSVYDNAVKVSYVSQSAVSDGAAAGSATGDDTGTFKITFDVSAFGQDIYIDGDVMAATGTPAGADGVTFATSTDSTATSTAAVSGIVGTPLCAAGSLGSCTLTSSETDATYDVTTAGQKSFRVKDGDTRRFTLEVKIGPVTGDISLMGISLKGINWDTDSGDTHASFYNFNLGSFKTDLITLNQQT
jgi:peptidoglycan hydrolase-like protein with peptidoglycan-binding domain